jgi:hypothetical protein
LIVTNSRIDAGEGRAIAARPSLCFFAFFLMVALASLAAPPAHAAPPKPVLTGTNPASPGASLRPRIKGLADEVIISVARMSADGDGGRIGLAADPDNTITVYEGDPSCLDAGAVVGVGTAEELEGAGILVAEGVVIPDSVTTFYATQEDETGTSACSAGVAYRQVTTPPEPPVLDSVSPPSPANENFPHLIGTADSEATVSIYSNATCSGAPLATGTGAAFAGGGIQVSVPDNSATTFYAAAALAGISSACSSTSISYQEVTPKSEPPPGEKPGGSDSGGKGQDGGPAPNPPGKPPAPTLRTIPGGTANDNTPLVAGSAPGAGKVEIFASAGCKGSALAKGSAFEFSAGLEVQVVDDTTVAFYGISIDGGGDRSACSPTPAIYVEDSTRPRTRITMGPGVKTRKRTAVFRFLDSAGGVPGTSFLCRVDRRKWRPCQTPFRAKRLSHSAHLFQVKAVDPAGNREARPAKRRFKVIR